MPKLDPPSKTYVHIPETVSQEAQAFLRTLQDPALMPAFPEPDDLAGWEKVRAHAEADAKAKSAPLLQRYEHTVTAESLGGVPVLDVRPKNWKDNGKVAVYTHGGAHVMNSAASMLGRAVVFAHETGLRVLSVDYTLAPLAKYNQMSDEVIRAIGALLKKGQRLADTAIYGDSSGGGLAAAVVLKMRDQGLGMPAAAVLVSPWLDVTPSGDTETTLHDADPNQLYEKHGKHAAAAFANPEDQKDPYASPVYGDYFQRVPADADPRWLEGDPAQRLRSILPGPRRCRSASQAGSLRGHDPQLPRQNPRCPGGDLGAPENTDVSTATPGNVRSINENRNSNEDACCAASNGSLGCSIEHAARVGSGLGSRVREDEHQSVGDRHPSTETGRVIGVAINAACTNLNPDGTRRHIRAALDAGASRDEILMVLKMASLLSIHSCSLGAPLLLEETKSASTQSATRPVASPTPACDKMRELGQWNEAWDPFFELDPVWTDQFMGTGIGVYASGALPAKEVELLSIAFDVSYTHMYAPGTRRHIKAALKLGATVDEIMEVLKLCVVQGVQACNLGVPILADELANQYRTP